jgi:hypothetical protein
MNYLLTEKFKNLFYFPFYDLKGVLSFAGTFWILSEKLSILAVEQNPFVPFLYVILLKSFINPLLFYFICSCSLILSLNVSFYLIRLYLFCNKFWSKFYISKKFFILKWLTTEWQGESEMSSSFVSILQDSFWIVKSNYFWSPTGENTVGIEK